MSYKDQVVAGVNYFVKAGEQIMVTKRVSILIYILYISIIIIS